MSGIDTIRKPRGWNLLRRVRSIALLDQLGPGLVTGAADDDPSGIATYAQAGAQAGYALLWTLVLTYPLMTAIQLVSAHIGRVTGCGLAKNMGEVMPRPIVTGLVMLLFIANTINLGADVASMGAAGHLVLGWGSHLLTIAFAILSLLLQMFIPYKRYANYLKWLTLVLFAYVAVLFTVHIDLKSLAQGLVLPRFTFSRTVATTIVAVFGTTISPYLFFWQTSQEVEEVEHNSERKPLVAAPRQARSAFRRIRFDTFFGMAVSNLIGLAIMVSAAATLHSAGRTDIQSAEEAARALAPLAGPFASLLFALGIVGTGLLAVPVLAGSAAYAVGESRGWNCGLDHKPWEAIGFYTVMAVATVLGLVIDYSGFNPIKALYWSAVVNGVIAVPIMAAMMLVVSHRKQMGKFPADWKLRLMGWLATAVMAAASIMMVLSS